VNNSTSVVKIYNATNSMPHFLMKSIFHYFKNAQAYYSADSAVVNSEVIRLAPGYAKIQNLSVKTSTINLFNCIKIIKKIILDGSYDRELQRQRCKNLQRHE
jgi:hypothetical protein